MKRFYISILKVLMKVREHGSRLQLTITERRLMYEFDRLPKDSKLWLWKLVGELEKTNDPANRFEVPVRTILKRLRSKSRRAKRMPNQAKSNEPMDVQVSEENACTQSTIDPARISNKEYGDNNNMGIEFTSSNVMNLTPVDIFEMAALQNIGNTCYMNAVLYVLRFTPTFLHNLHHFLANILFLKDEFDEPPSNTCEKTVSTNRMVLNQRYWPDELLIDQKSVKMFCELHKVFNSLTQRDRNRDGVAYQAYSLQNAVRDANNVFQPGTQQDSHEFLMFVLNGLRECSGSLSNLLATHPHMFDGITEPASALCFNFFRTNFMGQRSTMTRCYQCETESNHLEEMIDAFVTLPSDGQLNANFIKEHCVTSEKFEDSNKLKCSTCLRYTEKLQKTTFPHHPRVLIVHLGRFDNQSNKIDRAVRIVYRLDCFCSTCDGMPDKNHEYRLYGVIVHLGKTSSSGHYMAYVRSLQDLNLHDCDSDDCCKFELKATNTDRGVQHISNNWYLCDDDKITKVTRNEFDAKVNSEASLKTPYILFYARQDLIENN